MEYGGAEEKQQKTCSQEGMKTMRTVTLTKESTKDILENLLKRSPNHYGKFEDAVAEILKKVRNL